MTEPKRSGSDDATRRSAASTASSAAGDDDLPRWADRVVTVACLGVIAVSIALVSTFGHGRDQSIYALVAREMLHGGMPYRDAFDFKPPGIFYVYALARTFFGGAEWGIRVVEAGAMVLSALAMVRLAEQHAGSRRVGLVAAALASQVHAQLDFWHTAQPETFGGTLTLWGLVLASRADVAVTSRGRIGRLVASGVLFGAAGLMKPPLAGVGAVVAFALAIRALRASRAEGALDLRGALRPLVSVLVGGAIPFALTLAHFAATGALGDMREVLLVFTPYYTKISWEGRSVLSMAYYGVAEWLTTYSSSLLAGMIALAVLRPSKRELGPVLVLLGCIAIHITGIVMQAKFFQYHWGATFPLTALLAGLGLDKALRFANARLGIFGIAAFVAVFAVVAPAKCPVPSFGEAFTARSLMRADLIRYRSARPPEVTEAAWDSLASVADVDAGQNRAVARWIQAHTEPADPIFVWGFECAIYDLSERPIASRYIYNVPQRAWWSRGPMRAALLRDLDARPPRVIAVGHGDVFPVVTGDDLDSARSLHDFVALRELLDAEYEFGDRVGDYDLFVRVP